MKKYQNLLKENSNKQSMSRKGKHYKSEDFLGLVKSELFYLN